MMADVCLLLEGTYPFVSGGVSSWVHQLLLAHSDLSFHLVCLTPDDRPRVQKFQPPDNVRSVTCIPLQSLPMGQRVPSKQTRAAVEALLEIVDRLLRGVATVDDLTSFAKQAAGLGGLAGRTLLLDSRMAFETVKAGYDQIGSDSSFLDFFWSWRSLASAVLAVLLPPLPDARCYHAVSTGFAGLLG
ncbi:MAG: GT4 family glycosyltransferase PelF, partial [Janthinobacterium lividum]